MKHARLIVASTLLVAYVLLSLAINWHFLQDFDYAATRSIQDAIPRIFDFPFSILSLLGSFEFTCLFLLILLFGLFRPYYRFQLLGLFLLIVVVEWLGKELINQPGPPHEWIRYVPLFRLPTGGVYTPYSFPSGHAARSVFITTVLLAWLTATRLGTSMKRVLGVLLVAAELVMLVSRVDLADHWPSDVIGGALLAAAFALPAFSGDVDRIRRTM